MKWTGWYRLAVDSPWVAAVQADTLDDAARRLTRHLERRGLRLRNSDEFLTCGAGPPRENREDNQR